MRVRGKRVFSLPQRKHYFALNKPKGYLCSNSPGSADEGGAANLVADLFTDWLRQVPLVFHATRLDPDGCSLAALQAGLPCLGQALGALSCVGVLTSAGATHLHVMTTAAQADAVPELVAYVKNARVYSAVAARASRRGTAAKAVHRGSSGRCLGRPHLHHQ